MILLELTETQNSDLELTLTGMSNFNGKAKRLLVW